MARDKTDKTDATLVATHATSATWGIPDWRDAAAYGDVKVWTLGRWRWEFFRRRDDVRTLFDERKERQYKDDFEKWERNSASTDLTQDERAYILGKAPIKPDDPRFWVRCFPKEQEQFGYLGLFNPRIGNVSNFDNHVERLDSFEWAVSGERGGAVLQRTKLEKQHVVIAFSTDRPLARQLEDAGKYLKGLQKYRLGCHLKRPRHPTKWLGYLRTLDGKEAGATWAEMAETFFSQGLLDRHKDPMGGYCPPPPQAARDKWEAADALRFNL